jgi:LuxR family maltose regulon positive regulatory protein
VAAPAQPGHVEPGLLRPLVTSRSLPRFHATVSGIVEQLSDREILVTLSQPALQPGIAELVSLNTIKTHLKHIYRKLGVANRSEAIEMAESLGLL